VLWPAGGSGDLKVRRLAFEPDALEDAPDAELVTFASPALEELVTLAGASGRVARAFLNAPAGVSRSTAERLAPSYRFLDATWTGRLAELRAKYRLGAEVSLLSVLRLYLPRVVFDGRLAGKQGGASLRLVWDPIEQAGEPVRCPGCGGLS
jgi:hypothetical protein